MSNTKIEWSEKVWNPLAGCSRISTGCTRCYAETMANRLQAIGVKGYDGVIKNNKWTGKINLIPEKLEEPLRWKKPQRIFVNSMSDLFHENVPEDFIWKVIEKCWEAKQHDFLILTKRSDRMLDVLTKSMWWNNDTPENIWLGTSIEDQKTADERIPFLLQTPAAVRFISAEPLLGAVNLNKLHIGTQYPEGQPQPYLMNCLESHYLMLSDGDYEFKKLDWVIVGGESGHNARPMHPDWVRSIRDQCQAAHVPFFFKQGSKANWKNYKDFDLFPEDLQIREFPEVANVNK